MGAQGKGKEKEVTNKADTRYSLVPTDRKTIIQCVVIACLAVGAFFAIVHITALIIRTVVYGG